jgi:hypothetical protein
MCGIVYAFEAKLNKFLKFYAISILKIEMWGKGGAALLLVFICRTDFKIEPGCRLESAARLSF